MAYRIKLYRLLKPTDARENAGIFITCLALILSLRLTQLT